MGKKNLFITSVIIFMGFMYVYVRATDIIVSVTLPPGTLSVTLSQVDSKGTDSTADDTWTKQAGTDLNFGSLKEVKGTDPVSGPWSVMLPADNSFFAIDCGLNGGGYDSGKSIAVSYTPGTNGDKLGERVIISYEKTTLNPDGSSSDSPLIPEKKLLKDPRTVLYSEIEGGWLRLYIGIHNGKSGVVGAKTFSAANPMGTYSGTLVISLL